jgi:bacillithiol biosynthesis cysteine-adding enzyme BshC
MALAALTQSGPLCDSGRPVLPDSTTTASQAQGLDIREWSASRLSADYIYKYARLQDFYAGSPADPEAWRSAIARVQQVPRDRDGLVEVLESQLTRRGAPDQARAAARKLADPRTVALVTGQQAGLFGGPLYTLLKALTAAKLAADVEAQFGVPVVTVFWDHGEDHDWAEIASADVLDNDLQLQRITVADGEGAGRRPVGRVPLPDDIARAIDDLGRALPTTDFTAETVGILRDCYRSGSTMAEAFGQLMDRLLGPLGIVVFDGGDPAAKRWGADVFRRVLMHPGHTARLAARAGEALTAAGYHAQVTPQPDAIALFHMRDGRQPLRYVDGRFHAGDESWPADELLAELDAHPEHFSPNVLLRAVVQDRLFPTVAYVAGPSELAYLGQLREVYAFHETPMPIIVPRATATLLDAPAARFLERYQVDLPSLRAQDEHALNALLEGQLPAAVETSLTDADAALRDQVARLRAIVPAVDPTLEGAVQSMGNRLEHEIRGLRTKVIHAAKRRHDTLRRQFIRTQQLTFPGGHPQERVVSVAWFMNRYGPALVPRLYDVLRTEPGQHWLLQI